MKPLSSFVLDGKAQLDPKFSSYQLITTLDLMLNRSFQALSTSTNFIPEMLAELLPLAVNDKRRKVSGLTLNKVLQLGFAIFFSSRRQQYVLFCQMELDRDFKFFALSKFIQNNQIYKTWHIQYLTTKNQEKKNALSFKMVQLEKSVSGERTTFWPSQNTCRFWLEQALLFKSQIAQKYYRFTWKKTLQVGHGISLNSADLFKNLLLALDKAIDKYSVNRGTLTKCIEMWFKDSLSNPKYAYQKSDSQENKLVADLQILDPTSMETDSFHEKELQIKLAKFSHIPSIRKLLLLSGLEYRVYEQDDSN